MFGLFGGKKDEEGDENKEEEAEEDLDPEAQAAKERALLQEKNKERLQFFYDIRPEVKLPKLKMKPKDKEYMTMMRRWLVKMWNIKIQSLASETFNPFMQFMFGGNFYEVIKYDKDGLPYRQKMGERGLVFRTDYVSTLERNAQKFYEKQLWAEFDASYLMIEDQLLDIEIWDYNRWSMSDFKSHGTMPLIDIADGEVALTKMFVKPSNEKPFAKVTFSCILQEIWDFYLTLVDWKCINLMRPDGSLLKPSLTINLIVSSKTKGTINTAEKKEEKNPTWDIIPGAMNYRGAIAELEDQNIEIILWSKLDAFKKDQVTSKIVPLKNITETGLIKTEIFIPDYVDKKTLAAQEKEKKRLKKLGEIEDDDDEEKEKKLKKVAVEGKINVGMKPKYYQRGEILSVRSTEIYLVIHIGKVEKLAAPIDADFYNSFVMLEWGGFKKKTKIYYESLQPNFNETIFFHFPIKEAIRKNQEKFLKKLREDLQNKANLRIDLWAQKENSQQNLGSYDFFLNELSGASISELNYMYEEENKKFTFNTRQYVGKKPLSSAYVSSEPMVNLKIWFMPDLPYQFDMRVLPNKIMDLTPDPLKPILQDLEKSETFDQWKSMINANFRMESPYRNPIRLENFFKYVFITDQYKKKHIFSMFLAKISPPTFTNRVNQKVKIIDDDDKKKKKKKIEEIKEEGVEEEEEILNGVRTLEEILHFVRCIPYNKVPNHSILSTPDFFLASKAGDVEEHALLLASLFMGNVTETKEDIKKLDAIKREAEEAMKGKKKKKPPMGKDTKKIKKPGSKGKKGKKGKKEKPVEEENLNEEEKKEEEEEKNPIENRVFVCIGTLKKTKMLHAWVMIIDKDFKTVRMFEARNGASYRLPYRTMPNEREKLKKFINMVEG